MGDLIRDLLTLEPHEAMLRLMTEENREFLTALLNLPDGTNFVAFALSWRESNETGGREQLPKWD